MAALGSILRSLVLGPGTKSDTRPAEAEGPDPELEPGRVIYAIGDIHGRADCLRRLLDRIGADLAESHEDDPLLLFLGDYIDRGDDSRDVLDICADIASVWPHDAVFLRGNHEDAMMTFLDDPTAGAAWLRFGGLSTLMSYGVPNVAESMPGDRLLEASATLSARLPASHRDFLASTRLNFREGNLFFCHAGVDPATEVDAQSERTLMWGEGTAAPAPDWPWIVVHGHVVVDRPVLRRREVNVDTGAYFSGHLTAARITQGDIRFLRS